MNQKKHSKQTHNQAVKPQSAKGKPDAEYLNYKVAAKEGGSTMILSSGLSKVNANSMKNTLNSYVNNKHSNIPGAGKTSVKFIVIHQLWQNIVSKIGKKMYFLTLNQFVQSVVNLVKEKILLQVVDLLTKSSYDTNYYW